MSNSILLKSEKIVNLVSAEEKTIENVGGNRLLFVRQ